MTPQADDYFMSVALDEARKAERSEEVPVGAVIERDGKIIGLGFNHPISAADPTAHAEIVALRSAAHTIGNYRLTGATLYCTLEPCVMCAGAIVHARVARVVFGVSDPKAGAGGSVYNVLQDRRLNHRLEVVSGIRESECASLLRAFFERKRNIGSEIP
jgi:tRNA(adenine34) deaminase